MTPSLISAVILVSALVMFVSERVRHDLIAIIALLACVATGLVGPTAALSGFGDPAVIAVAAVLIVGRALELTGVAGRLTRVLIPQHASFSVKLAILMGAAAVLSGFMNNIAALVITMPLATAIARDSKRQPGATLMPLAFATILGGMTTLIGTPANLILSSVRERELGAPFGFFTMAPVGVAVAGAGLLYLTLLGWRLLPDRRSAAEAAARPWRVFEIDNLPPGIAIRSIAAVLRGVTTRVLTLVRDHRPIALNTAREPGDRLLVLSRVTPEEAHRALQIPFTAGTARDEASARMVVAHGSPLVGKGHASVRFMTNAALRVTAAGPRAARLRRPLSTITINTGDQLFVTGRPQELAKFAGRLRLLEIDRSDIAPVDVRAAIATTAIFGSAIAVTILLGVPPAISFLGAAALIAGLRLIATSEVYASVDWSVIVLLAAMIPVGASFETSGAAGIVAQWLGQTLTGAPLVIALAAVCTATLVLSVFLNNVATSIIMGPLAIKVAIVLGIAPDAMLLAVLIGASSDFLTPIGHQNNLLVMGPGGYRCTDYARAGALLSVLVVSIASVVLAALYA